MVMWLCDWSEEEVKVIGSEEVKKQNKTKTQNYIQLGC